MSHRKLKEILLTFSSKLHNCLSAFGSHAWIWMLVKLSLRPMHSDWPNVKICPFLANAKNWSASKLSQAIVDMYGQWYVSIHLAFCTFLIWNYSKGWLKMLIFYKNRLLPLQNRYIPVTLCFLGRYSANTSQKIYISNDFEDFCALSNHREGYPSVL